ncbi:MAG: desulfoferrodoxin family protein [Candidatus Aminicenantes bacterium]|nr:desulfoferrodoxin family protein [Candidatus Aminicenantes bacterium]
MNRIPFRIPILILAAAGLVLGLAAQQTKPAAAEEVVYTATSPGPWAGKEPTHVPQIAVAKTEAGWSVTITVKHGMIAQPLHFIQWIRLQDGDGAVLGRKEFTPADPKPEAVFALKTLPAKLVAFEHCNLHGLWKNERESAAK